MKKIISLIFILLIMILIIKEYNSFHFSKIFSFNHTKKHNNKITNKKINTNTNTNNKLFSLSSKTNDELDTIYIPNNNFDTTGNTITSIYLNGPFSPLERIILTANGNLQRILSSYYNANVTIEIKKFIKINDNLYEREVHEIVNNEIICIAYSQVEIYSEESKDALENKKIGIFLIL